MQKNNDVSRGTQQGALFLQDKRQSGQRRTGSLDKKQGIAGRRVRAIAVTGFSTRLSQRSGVVRQGLEEGGDKRRLAKRRLKFIELHNINTTSRLHVLFYTYTFNQAF